MSYNNPPPLAFTSNRLEGRVILVTGASSGIGAAACSLFAREGAKVIAAARREDRIHALADELKGAGLEASAVVCDVRDEASSPARSPSPSRPMADWTGPSTTPAPAAGGRRSTRPTPQPSTISWRSICAACSCA